MDTKKLGLGDQVKLAHEQIRHEDGLVNHRLSWLLTIQGLLFASLGIMFKESETLFAVYIICILGFISSTSAGYALRVSARVLAQRHNEIDRLLNDNGSAIPPLLSAKADKWTFLYPWFLLPFSFAVSWFAVFSWILIFR